MIKKQENYFISATITSKDKRCPTFLHIMGQKRFDLMNYGDAYYSPVHSLHRYLITNVWVHPWLAQDVCELLKVSSVAGTKKQKPLLTFSLENEIIN